MAGERSGTGPALGWWNARVRGWNQSSEPQLTFTFAAESAGVLAATVAAVPVTIAGRSVRIASRFQSRAAVRPTRAVPAPSSRIGAWVVAVDVVVPLF